MSFFRPYTPGVICPLLSIDTAGVICRFLGRTHQGLFLNIEKMMNISPIVNSVKCTVFSRFAQFSHGLEGSCS